MMLDALDGMLGREQVRTIMAIAEHGSFNRAASALGVTQSAISQQIKRLEEKLSCRLFERAVAGVKLTTDGEAVLIYARSVARVGRDLTLQLSCARDDAPLRIGISEDFGRTALPAVLGLTTRVHKSLRIHAVCAVSSDTLFGMLDDDKLDVVVTRQDRDAPRGETIWTQSNRWVGRHDLQLPVRDPVPLVLPPAGVMRRELTRALQEASRTWRVTFEGFSIAVLEAAVHAGLGVSACGEDVELIGAVTLDGAAGLPPLPPTQFVLERPRNARSGAAEAFCEILRTAAGMSFLLKTDASNKFRRQDE